MAHKCGPYFGTSENCMGCGLSRRPERRLEQMEARAQDLEEALEAALAAMQANIAYAAFKDERALADAIPMARAALAKARGETP